MPILIVGAGVFGLSTAYHLLRGGEREVIVLDKSDVFPVPDGASTDINRVVRSSYGDPFYTRLCTDAIEQWKSNFPGIYTESGVLSFGDSGYVVLAQANDEAAGGRVTRLNSPEEFAAQFPSGVNIGTIKNNAGFINKSCGWANAAKGTKSMYDKVVALGGNVQGGKRIQGLAFDSSGDRVVGVRLVSGEEVLADKVIIATGSWTPSIFSGDEVIRQRLTATGQSIATIKLTEHEYETYKDVPVVMDFVSGFYSFPPNEDRILKFAVHDGGVINPLNNGEPRTILSHPENGLCIPKDKLSKLKEHFRSLYPDLADRPYHSTRLCWYCDTEDTDWLIDFHPKYRNVMFATGGSGHAYKFLPVLGRLVVQRLGGTLDDEVVRKFAFDRSFSAHLHPDRLYRRTEILVEGDLAKVEDL